VCDIRASALSERSHCPHSLFHPVLGTRGFAGSDLSPVSFRALWALSPWGGPFSFALPQPGPESQEMDDRAGVRLLTSGFDYPDSPAWVLHLGMERHFLADPGGARRLPYRMCTWDESHVAALVPGPRLRACPALIQAAKPSRSGPSNDTRGLRARRALHLTRPPDMHCACGPCSASWTGIRSSRTEQSI
jgi:hypothetical protein